MSEVIHLRKAGQLCFLGLSSWSLNYVWGIRAEVMEDGGCRDLLSTWHKSQYLSSAAINEICWHVPLWDPLPTSFHPDLG